MIGDRYLKLREKVPKEVSIVVVSKGQPLSFLLEFYQAGARDFGENRLSEFLEKKASLPKDIRWHMIGAIQTKKVPKVVGQFSLIHSVDSLQLAEKIDRRGVLTPILLEANVSGEPQKHGLEAEAWLEGCSGLKNFKNLVIEGLMTLAPYTEDVTLIRNTFRKLRQLKEAFQERGYPLHHLSMGMSHDWQIALDEGATLLRIGSLIFNE